jgi:hypothetical protein
MRKIILNRQNPNECYPTKKAYKYRKVGAAAARRARGVDFFMYIASFWCGLEHLLDLDIDTGLHGGLSSQRQY